MSALPKLHTTEEPDAVLISRRLQDLVSTYGKQNVDDEVILGAFNDIFLRRHLKNLMLTYSVVAVVDMWEIING